MCVCHTSTWGWSNKPSLVLLSVFLYSLSSPLQHRPMPDFWDRWSQGSYVYMLQTLDLCVWWVHFGMKPQNLSPLVRWRLKILLVNYTTQPNTPKRVPSLIMNPHDVRFKPNNLHVHQSAFHAHPYSVSQQFDKKLSISLLT